MVQSSIQIKTATKKSRRLRFARTAMEVLGKTTKSRVAWVQKLDSEEAIGNN